MPWADIYWKKSQQNDFRLEVLQSITADSINVVAFKAAKVSATFHMRFYSVEQQHRKFC